LRVRPASLSRSIHRVAYALGRHAPPWAVVVPRASDADVVIHHLVGLTGWAEQLAADRAAGKRYVLIQYCLRSTEDPRPETWLPIWQSAALVWSYYDLPAFAGTDDFPHFLSPLGVDTETFRPPVGWPAAAPAEYLIGTSGFVAETEGVLEAYRAVERIPGGKQFHLGPIPSPGPQMVTAHGITDATLAVQWGACRFVAGLRRCEGFELPALEGLACGARAVCFDAPHYREWYGEHAEYVPETDAATVTDVLADLFARPPRPVTPAERAHIAATFDWQHIAGAFWDALRDSLG